MLRYKSERRRRKQKHSERCFSSQITATHEGAQLSLEMAEYLTAHGKQEINSLLCFHVWLLPCLLNCLHLNPLFFSPFPSASLPHPTDGIRKHLWGAELPVRGKQQKKNPKTPTFPCLFNSISEWPLTTISLPTQKSDVATWDLPMSNRSFILIFYFLLEKQMVSLACIKRNPSFELN